MAIVNKFGGNVQVAGSVTSYVVEVAPDTTAYPVQVGIASTTTLASASAQNVLVDTTNGVATFALPAPTAANEGEIFTVTAETGAANDLTVTADGGARGPFSEALVDDNDFVTLVCENQIDAGLTFGWTLVATNL